MTRTRVPLAASSEVMALLRETGLAHVRVPAERTAFTAAARRLLAAFPHPDAGADGVTVLRPRPDGRDPGRAGFTQEALLAHTERAGVPVPPHLMLLACVRPGSSGGLTTLVDGEKVFSFLCERAPQAATVLSSRGAAYFGGATGHAGAVFERTSEGRWTIRLRLDELARFSPRAEPHLPELLDAIKACTTMHPLAAGEGVLLDNTRWLHGRQPFHGNRVMWRVLGAPITPLARGFYASWAYSTPMLLDAKPEK
ncbi:TauD/TfdA family dioxygenase [Nocardiopsis suaedae]|uniref:TauD/TfdA family dioxygenase n=1 Tax=Nocardiopsis suaedae TaxID=3018444 RepID=A0ABT4TTY9_9ACTN|nr:TauD/TfdA family dioxygenase [Nocardiopsis suaedae]MDA2807627.1 TauD/TfdA family dioxygenase [Nocardiopsis suaedae]